MIDWLIAVAYLAGWLWTARTVAFRMTESEAATELANRRRRGTHWSRPISGEGEPLVDTEDRIMNAMVGFMVGSVWPFALLILLFSNTLRVPSEVAEEQRQELEQLRKLAREHGLPMPGLDKKEEK